MSDLVERLRTYTHEDNDGYSISHIICDEAADEITRLRQQLGMPLETERENARLRAEVEALRADAARYRWLRKESVDGWNLLGHYTQDALDAAIDAARKT